MQQLPATIESSIEKRIKDARQALVDQNYSQALEQLNFFIDEPNALSTRHANSILRVISEINEMNEINLTSKDEFILYEIKGICFAKLHNFNQVIELYRSIERRYAVNNRFGFLFIRLIKYLIRYGDDEKAKSIADEVLEMIKNDDNKKLMFDDKMELVFISYYHHINNHEDLFFQAFDKLIQIKDKSSIVKEYDEFSKVKYRSDFLKTELIQLSILRSKRLMFKGDINSAVDLLKKAKIIIEDLPRKYSLYLMIDGQLATAFAWKGSFDDTREAIAIFKEIIHISRIIQDEEYEKRACHNLGAILIDIAQSEYNILDRTPDEYDILDAIPYLERARDLANIQEQPQDILIHLSLLEIFIRKGDVDQISKFFTKKEFTSLDELPLDFAKAQIELIKNKSSVLASILDKIYQGLHSESFEIMNKLWWCQFYLENHLRFELTHDNKTSFHFDKTKVGSIIENIHLSEKDTSAEYGHYKHVWGLYALAGKHYDDAIKNLQESIKLRKSIKYTYSMCESLVWCIEAYIQNNDYAAAKATANEAKKLLKRFGTTIPLYKRIDAILKKIPKEA